MKRLRILHSSHKVLTGFQFQMSQVLMEKQSGKSGILRVKEDFLLKIDQLCKHHLFGAPSHTNTGTKFRSNLFWVYYKLKKKPNQTWQYELGKFQDVISSPPISLSQSTEAKAINSTGAVLVGMYVARTSFSEEPCAHREGLILAATGASGPANNCCYCCHTEGRRHHKCPQGRDASTVCGTCKRPQSCCLLAEAAGSCSTRSCLSCARLRNEQILPLSLET